MKHLYGLLLNYLNPYEMLTIWARLWFPWWFHYVCMNKTKSPCSMQSVQRPHFSDSSQHMPAADMHTTDTFTCTRADLLYTHRVDACIDLNTCFQKHYWSLQRVFFFFFLMMWLFIHGRVNMSNAFFFFQNTSSLRSTFDHSHHHPSK